MSQATITIEWRNAMLGWLTKKVDRDTPTVQSMVIGEVRIISGSLLIADPTFMSPLVRIEGIPVGSYPIEANVIRYPEGGKHVSGIRVRFGNGGTEKRTLGKIDVDSAMIILVDESVSDLHWKCIGPKRIGRTSTPKHYLRVAKLIRKEFDLSFQQVGFLRCVFDEPISEELEAKIIGYLKTMPEYSENTFLYFRIETQNTRDRIYDDIQVKSWCETVLDETTGNGLFTVSSGFGDGTYTVEGSFANDELRAFEIDFIGPAQDPILEALPYLRQGACQEQ